MSHVLIVEDDPDIRHMLAVRLQAAGFEVTVAADGRIGWSSVQRNRPDVIVLDVRLPGMSGLELCRRIRADIDLAGIGIVITTASVDEASVAAAFDAGADDFVAKPFSLAVLLGRIRSVAMKATEARELTHVA